MVVRQRKSLSRCWPLLKQNEIKAAFDKATEAANLGLPFERLLVGPREELSKLHDLPRFQTWKKQQRPSKLIHGPMIGNVTGKSASFWVRTDGEAKVRLIVGGGTAIADEQVTRAETDFTAVLNVNNLSPRQSYEYRLLIDGKSVALGDFQTFAKNGEGESVFQSALVAGPVMSSNGSECGTTF